MTAQSRRLVADGLTSGLIAYTLVGAFFVVLNLAAGRSALYTVALVGEALFSGVREPAAVTLAAGPILAFNGVHLAACLLFGFFSAWLVYEAELHPEFWYLTLFLFLGATVISYAGVLALMVLVGSPLSTGSIVAASLVAAVGIGAYLVARHRSVVGAVHQTRETRAG